MRILDRYIIKKFLFTFFFILAVIMLIAMVFDVSENIDDFLKRGAPLYEIIFSHYVNFIIYYGNLFSPLLIFISVIFFTSQMAAKTEIVAILSSGISFRRMLFPYFIAATVLASLSFYLNNWGLPQANKERLEFESTYLKNPYKNRHKNIHKQISPGVMIYFDKYNASKDIGYKFSIEKWDGNVMTYKLLSDLVRWDTTSKTWIAENYFIREIDGDEETITTGKKLDSAFAFQPEEFRQRKSNVQMMNYQELNTYIEEESLKGSSSIPFYLIEQYSRTSLPFATYILTLIGVSMASRKVRGGIGAHIALGMLVAVSYILAMKVTQVYATNAGFNPFFAVWIPNIIFGIVAIYLFRRAPK